MEIDEFTTYQQETSLQRNRKARALTDSNQMKLFHTMHNKKKSSVTQLISDSPVIVSALHYCSFSVDCFHSTTVMLLLPVREAAMASVAVHTVSEVEVLGGRLDS